MPGKPSRNWGGHRKGAGRPRTRKQRCGCGIMTLKRAVARGKSSDHDPSCSFYRERAIIV